MTLKRKLKWCWDWIGWFSPISTKKTDLLNFLFRIKSTWCWCPVPPKQKMNFCYLWNYPTSGNLTLNGVLHWIFILSTSRMTFFSFPTWNSEKIFHILILNTFDCICLANSCCHCYLSYRELHRIYAVDISYVMVVHSWFTGCKANVELHRKRIIPIKGFNYNEDCWSTGNYSNYWSINLICYKRFLSSKYLVSLRDFRISVYLGNHYRFLYMT